MVKIRLSSLKERSALCIVSLKRLQKANLFWSYSPRHLTKRPDLLKTGHRQNVDRLQFLVTLLFGE